MGRLRQALETHYSQNGPVDDLCIYLQPGSYAVRLGQLAKAYPTLYRPLSAALNTAALPEPETTAPFEPVLADTLARTISAAPRRTWRYLVAAAVICVVALFALGFVWQGGRTTDTARFSPILEIMPVDAGEDQNAVRTSRIVTTTLANGLPRFKLAQVRVIQANAIIAHSNSEDRIYQLNTQIVQQEGLPDQLFLRLTDAGINTTIWSREMAIPQEPAKVSDALIPLLAEINGPFGVIATRGRTLFKDVNNGGYACLIKYFGFLKSRDRNIETQIEACFQKPVEETRLRATILAARAFFALESEKGQQNPSAAMIEARKLARLAVEADPDDGAARYAMARLAYFSADCVSARFYTQKAVEANPNSPIILGNLASLAPQCAYKNADKLLDRAFLVQTDGDANGRLLLVMAAISQGRADKVAEFAEINVLRSGNQRVPYYLTETLIAASQDRDQDAKRNWRLFSDALPAQMTTPDQKLQRIILSPAMRRRLLGYLDSKSVFGTMQK
jgi:tetratricopeptide (TPR) repeat protein